ncbi:class I SAM-dependent methyltransferase [Hyphomicrobium sp. 2TAF46]|uniref:class I SAM-dependent methyltransferase n=1 Tax=Hyphomicrobium sp. 2TAF46 TaxID=3233019 RepID=UPI003F8DEE34
MVTNDDIRGAYRHLLGREPESDEVVERHLKTVTDLHSLRARFISAPEFYQTNARELLRYFSIWEARRKHGSVDYDCSSAELDRLFAHIKDVWSKLGEVEPHFSVVSTQNFKPENLGSNIEAFHRSGKGEIDLLQSELMGHGLKTAGYSHCVELGCGVGRVTRFLAEMSDRTTGFDISAPHLKLASEYLAAEGVRNASLELIKDPASVEFPPCDLFYSRIVLQHNPPPVMFFLLRKFLRALVPGGVAVFQLPTFIDGYTFKVDTYLDGMDKLDNQELHALPQKAVFAAIADADCDVLSTYRDNSLSKITQISSRFVVMKR